MALERLASWWVRRRMIGQVARALESTAGTRREPQALLSGSGVLLVPSDPVEAALQSFALADFLARLPGPVRLAGLASSLRWMPDSPNPPVELPVRPERRGFAQWLETHRASRADWSFLLSARATPLEEAALAWLGAGRRFAAWGSCTSSSPNVLLKPAGGDDPDSTSRRLLGILVGDLPERTPPAPAKGGGATVLELPSGLPEKGRTLQAWIRIASTLSATRPIVVAHADPLPVPAQEAIRSLGPRVAQVALEGARDARDLARRAGLWIGPRSPASALAAMEGCRVHVVGSQRFPIGFPLGDRTTFSAKIDGPDSGILV